MPWPITPVPLVKLHFQNADRGSEISIQHLFWLKWIDEGKTSVFVWNQDSLLVKHQTRDRKAASSNSGRSIYFSRVNFVCWFLFGVHSTPMLLQWQAKEPGHSARSAGGRLYINTHTPLTQQSQNGLTMLLFRHSVGAYQEMSSHATCQGTPNHSHLSSLSQCGLILA